MRHSESRGTPGQHFPCKASVENVLKGMDKKWDREQPGDRGQKETLRLIFTEKFQSKFEIFFFLLMIFLNLEDKYFIVSWQALKNLKIIRYNV